MLLRVHSEDHRKDKTIGTKKGMRELLGVMEMFCFDYGGVYMTTHLSKLIKLHLQGANFMVYKLNLTKSDFTKQNTTHQKLWKVGKSNTGNLWPYMHILEKRDD